MIRPVGTSTTAITKANSCGVSEVRGASNNASLCATTGDSYSLLVRALARDSMRQKVRAALGNAEKLEAAVEKAQQTSFKDCENPDWNGFLKSKQVLSNNLKKLNQFLPSGTTCFDRATYKQTWYECARNYRELCKHLDTLKNLPEFKQKKSLCQIVEEVNEFGVAIMGCISVMPGGLSHRPPIEIASDKVKAAQFDQTEVILPEKSVDESSAAQSTAPEKKKANLAKLTRNNPAPERSNTGIQPMDEVDSRAASPSRNGAMHSIPANGQPGSTAMPQTMDQSFNSTVNPSSPVQSRNYQQKEAVSSKLGDSAIELSSTELSSSTTDEEESAEEGRNSPTMSSQKTKSILGAPSQNFSPSIRRTSSNTTLPRIVVSEGARNDESGIQNKEERPARSRQASAAWDIKGQNQKIVRSIDIAENSTNEEGAYPSYLSATQVSLLASSSPPIKPPFTPTRERVRTFSQHSWFSLKRPYSRIATTDINSSDSESELGEESFLESEQARRLARSRQASAAGIVKAVDQQTETDALENTRVDVLNKELAAAQAEAAQLKAELREEREKTVTQAKNQEQVAQLKIETQKLTIERNALNRELVATQAELRRVEEEKAAVQARYEQEKVRVDARLQELEIMLDGALAQNQHLIAGLKVESPYLKNDGSDSNSALAESQKKVACLEENLQKIESVSNTRRELLVGLRDQLVEQIKEQHTKINEDLGNLRRDKRFQQALHNEFNARINTIQMNLHKLPAERRPEWNNELKILSGKRERIGQMIETLNSREQRLQQQLSEVQKTQIVKQELQRDTYHYETLFRFPEMLDGYTHLMYLSSAALQMLDTHNGERWQKDFMN